MGKILAVFLVLGVSLSLFPESEYEGYQKLVADADRCISYLWQLVPHGFIEIDNGSYRNPDMGNIFLRCGMALLLRLLLATPFRQRKRLSSGKICG
jgi:hypothetical protein